MATVLVLGAAGGVGQAAVQCLTGFDTFQRIVVCDLRAADVQLVVDRLKDPRLAVLELDVTDEKKLKAAMAGKTVVLNCVGPFYRFGPPILKAAIEACVNYVDVCDDLDPTQHMLKLDDMAKERGVKALIGMGSSPGLANVFVRLCADMFLDSVTGADIMHIHGGESTEGAAVLKHRIHAMVNDVPLYFDGKFIDVRQLEKSGEDHVEEVDFMGVGKFPVFVYPHPETITLPMHMPDLKRATNKGVIFPLSYFRLTQDMVRVGACSSKPVRVGNTEVNDLDFSVAHIQSRRPELLREAGITGPAGCLRVVVDGLRREEKRRMVLQMASTSEGAGPGTGIPAAIGAILMAQGQIDRHGVFPPEAAVPALTMLALANQAFGRLPHTSEGGSAAQILLEQWNADGNVVDLTQQFTSKL